MTPRRAVWCRYWLLVTWVTVLVGVTTFVTVLIVTHESRGEAATAGLIAAAGPLALGIYDTAAMRRTINREQP